MADPAAANNADTKRPSPDRDGLLHGSCVSFEGKGILILGQSGSGKSALALDLMSRGAELVADDQVLIDCRHDRLWAQAPDTIAGRIEARYIGVLKAAHLAEASIDLVVDLGRTEKKRLPDWHTFTRCGVTLPLLFALPHPHFAPAILQYVKHGRSD